MRIEYKDLKVEKVSSGGDSYHDVSHTAWHITAPPALDVHYIQWGTSNMSGADWCHDMDGSRYDSLQRLLGHEVLVSGAPKDTEAGVYDDGTVDLEDLINEVIEGIEHGDVTGTSPGSVEDEKYPEHKKLAAVMDESQIVGHFLDHSPYTLAEYRDIDGFRDPQLMPVTRSTEQVLAAFYNIDLAKIDAEKRQMLDEMRAAHTKETDR